VAWLERRGCASPMLWRRQERAREEEGETEGENEVGRGEQARLFCNEERGQAAAALGCGWRKVATHRPRAVASRSLPVSKISDSELDETD
jgi:hypothetical protein